MAKSLPRPSQRLQAALIDDNREVRLWSLPPSGRPVAYRTVAPATVLAWRAPSCFAAATGSDNDRPPVAESPARIRRSDSPTSWSPIEAPKDAGAQKQTMTFKPTPQGIDIGAGAFAAGNTSR